MMEENIGNLGREELEAELKKCKEITNMIATTLLGGVAKMSLPDMRILNASEGYYRMTGYTEEESLQPPFSGRGVNLVIPEDAPRVGMAVEAMVRENRPIQVDYRIRKKDGSISWNTACCSGIEEGSEGRYLQVFFLDSTQAKNTELQLTSLLNNMSSGLVRMRVDTGAQILYANHEFYRQIGRTPEAFEAPPLACDYLTVIHPEDRDMFLERARSFIRVGRDTAKTEFRITTEHGEIRWIRAYASKLYEELQGENLLQYILTDVTGEREQLRQNMLNEERFRIIAEQTRDVVFDWDVTTDSIHYSPVFEKMFGIPPPPSISTQSILEGDLFYEEDKPTITKLIEDMRDALPYGECRVRMKGRDGTYFWALHRTTTIFDENCKSMLVVGIISDVNDFMTATLALQHQAAHDPLTGLLNRTAAQDLIEPLLDHTGGGGKHIFIQFDIDHFKQINDFMGHAAGDFALQKIALQMRELFRSDDILVRMGGDEFAAFLVNPSTVEGVTKKLKRFLQTVHCNFKFEEKIYPLSVSVGASVYPQDGVTFQALYEHADAALYEAKRAGGNQLVFYTPQTRSGKGLRLGPRSTEQAPSYGAWEN